MVKPGSYFTRIRIRMEIRDVDNGSQKLNTFQLARIIRCGFDDVILLRIRFSVKYELGLDSLLIQILHLLILLALWTREIQIDGTNKNNKTEITTEFIKST